MMKETALASPSTDDEAAMPDDGVAVPVGNGGEPFTQLAASLHGIEDPEIYAAWKNHIIHGFEQNGEMFTRTLDTFIKPYRLIVWMNGVLLAVGVLGFVAAAVLGMQRGIGFAFVFAGLSAVIFLTYLVNQPTRSLEQNIQFTTWLSFIYNTYWSRLMHANLDESIQGELDGITKTTIAELVQLIDKHAELSGQSLGVPVRRDRVMR